MIFRERKIYTKELIKNIDTLLNHASNLMLIQNAHHTFIYMSNHVSLFQNFLFVFCLRIYLTELSQ